MNPPIASSTALGTRYRVISIGSDWPSALTSIAELRRRRLRRATARASGTRRPLAGDEPHRAVGVIARAAAADLVRPPQHPFTFAVVRDSVRDRPHRLCDRLQAEHARAALTR